MVYIKSYQSLLIDLNDTLWWPVPWQPNCEDFQMGSCAYMWLQRLQKCKKSKLQVRKKTYVRSAYLKGVCRLLLSTVSWRMINFEKRKVILQRSKIEWFHGTSTVTTANADLTFFYQIYIIRGSDYISCNQMNGLDCRHPSNKIFLNDLMMIFFKEIFLIKSASKFLWRCQYHSDIKNLVSVVHYPTGKKITQ